MAYLKIIVIEMVVQDDMGKMIWAMIARADHTVPVRVKGSLIDNAVRLYRWALKITLLINPPRTGPRLEKNRTKMKL